MTINLVLPVYRVTLPSTIMTDPTFTIIHYTLIENFTNETSCYHVIAKIFKDS